jgi:MFS transporter, ACS family, hexuronate transporter
MQETATPAFDVVPYCGVILAMMVACFMFTLIVRYTWPPLIPKVVPLVNPEMAQAAAVMSAFFFGYLITRIPTGLLQASVLGLPVNPENKRD